MGDFKGIWTRPQLDVDVHAVLEIESPHFLISTSVNLSRDQNKNEDVHDQESDGNGDFQGPGRRGRRHPTEA